MRRTPSIVLLFVFACGGAPARPVESADPATAEPEALDDEAASPRQPLETLASDGRIDRGMLGVVLDAGLGRFLQGVETEPALNEGRFIGFRLLSLYPDDPRMADAGLERGDVITRINGQPIERPEQALRVWDGLRVASELVIEYRRDDAQHELRFAIVD